ncbi:MAG: DUF4331 family protein [Gemmatimonadales bacterium]
MRTATKLLRVAAPLALATVFAACEDRPHGFATGPSFNAVSSASREFRQRERLGNPLVSEVMIVKARHHQHNAGTPATDVAQFTDDLTGFVTGVAGRDPAYANAIAGALLPDMLIAYPKRDGTPVFWLSWVFGGFGGRSLSDDVVDIGLGALFGSLLGNTNNVTAGLTTDNVDANDKDFASTFPYLATAH